MGREANVTKERVCPLCAKILVVTGKELRSHIANCKGLEA
jgi:hypothetical protein